MRISDWSSDVCSSDLIVVDILIEYAKLKPSAPRCFAQGEIHCLCGLDGIRIFLEASGTFDEPGLEAVGGKAVARRINLSDARHAFLPAQRPRRSEERRVGKECVSTCRSRWWCPHEKKKQRKTQK